MKDYLSKRIGYRISEDQFKECVDYFVEYAGYIKETLEDMGKEKKIKEGACLEAEIGEKFVEVWVKYSWMIDGESGNEIVLIGLDYGYVDYFE